MCSNHDKHSAANASSPVDKPHVCCGRCNGEGKRMGAQPSNVAIPIASIGKAQKPAPITPASQPQ